MHDSHGGVPPAVIHGGGPAPHGGRPPAPPAVTQGGGPPPFPFPRPIHGGGPAAQSTVMDAPGGRSGWAEGAFEYLHDAVSVLTMVAWLVICEAVEYCMIVDSMTVVEARSWLVRVRVEVLQ